MGIQLPYETKIGVLKREFWNLNHLLFDGELPRGCHEFSIMQKKSVWAHYIPCDRKLKSGIVKRCGLFEVHDHFISKQYLRDTLAHEMIHHYQWTVEEVDPHHGQTFKDWEDTFTKHGISLFERLDSPYKKGRLE